MFDLQRINHENGIGSVRLSWELFVMRPTDWQRHLYKTILSRDPEEGAIDDARLAILKFGTAEKIEGIFNFIESDESRIATNDDYIEEMQIFCSALGYRYSNKYVAQQICKDYTDRESFFSNKKEIINIISSNTEMTYYTLESDYKPDISQIAVNMEILTKEMQNISEKLKLVEESNKHLLWRLADFQLNIKQNPGSQGDVINQIADMISIIADKYSEQVR